MINPIHKKNYTLLPKRLTPPDSNHQVHQHMIHLKSVSGGGTNDLEPCTDSLGDLLVLMRQKR